MASFRSMMTLDFPEYTLIEFCTWSVKFAREDVRLKKCTELNGGQLEHIALEYTKIG